MSYGLTSLALFAEVGGIYMNFALWAISIPPVWLVLRHFGSEKEQPQESIESKDAKLVGTE